METLDEGLERAVTLWMEPYSDRIVIQTPDFAIRVSELDSVKVLGYQLLEAADKLEKHMQSGFRIKCSCEQVEENDVEKAINAWDDEILYNSTNHTDNC